jgi:hypothetical protein
MAILTLFFLNVVDQRVIIFDVFFVRVWLRLRVWGFWLGRLGFRFGIGLRCRWFWLWFRRLWLWGWRNVMCNITFMSFNA